MQETWVWSLGWEDALEKEMAACFQYSCLENPMDTGAWSATVHGVVRVGYDSVTKPPHLKVVIWRKSKLRFTYLLTVVPGTWLPL